mgnify:CR=1 FL=1
MRVLHPEQRGRAEVADGRSDPCDLNANTDTLRATSSDPHSGHGTEAVEENTSSSKSSPHPLQLYS